MQGGSGEERSAQRASGADPVFDGPAQGDPTRASAIFPIVQKGSVPAELDHELELERDLDLLGRVASNELRAPLRTIATLARWIEEDLGDRASPSRAHLAQLHRRVRRMQAMIDGVHAYAEARRRLPDVLVHVDELVRDLTVLLAPGAGQRIVARPDLPAVRAPRIAFLTVLQHLIANALAHGGPHVSVKVSGLEVDGGWSIAVADDGPGIDRRHHERIWELFQTLCSRDDVEHSGVGLAIVKKIVERRGGTVGVESVPGRCSSFEFFWPRVARFE